jgi:cystathionine beta-synthase
MSTILPDSSLALIGGTPILRLTRFDTGPCTLFLKLENQNPGGSIKDRVGLSMIEAAERDGHLWPGALIVEATAGNTGLGLAQVAARKGYPLLLVVPDKMSREKILHLRALGAEVVVTRSDVGKGHPEYYQDLAQRLATERRGYYVNQFENPANPLAHERSTGPEIWSQLDERVDAVVVGVGSGGTLTGLSRYFARVQPELEMVLADPEGSIVAEYVQTGRHGEAGSWLVEGVGEDFIPPLLDVSRVRASYTVSDEEAFATVRTLLREEGVLAGSSTGVLLTAALRYCREQSTPKRVVTFACDSGNKYLSKVFDDHWMRDQGFLRSTSIGDLRDVIGRPHMQAAAGRAGLVFVDPTDTLERAWRLMKLHDVSQLPVLSGEVIVGLLDESDLLLAVTRDRAAFALTVDRVMTRELRTLGPDTPLEALMPIFDAGLVALVVDQGRFLGLITRMDLLQCLRRSVH